MIVTKDIAKIVRNNRLIESDLIVAELTDPKQIKRWAAYRDKLRKFFDDKPEDYNYDKLVWPRTPIDEDELLRKAAEGDEEAKKIVKKDKING